MKIRRFPATRAAMFAVSLLASASAATRQTPTPAGEVRVPVGAASLYARDVGCSRSDRDIRSTAAPTPRRKSVRVGPAALKAHRAERFSLIESGPKKDRRRHDDGDCERSLTTRLAISPGGRKPATIHVPVLPSGRK